MRRRFTHLITVALRADVFFKVKAIAYEQGISAAALLRSMVEKELCNKTTEPKTT